MYRLIHGDCIEVLKTLEADSIDCVVTDPPYGLKFMGKEWDKTLPPREAFRECLRVLKPGALALIMSSPRQDLLWRMMAVLEEVGFELKQSFISWIYKTGFPKGYNIEMGIKKRENFSPSSKKWGGWRSIAGLKPALECILMVNKPLSEKTIVDNVLKWGTGAINVDATRIPLQTKEDTHRIIKVPRFKGTHYAGGQVYDPRVEGKWESGGSSLGRFPANLIISDQALDDGRITKSPSGKVRRKKNMGRTWSKDTCGLRSNPSDLAGYGDVGSPYRYFDLDAWARHHGFLDVPKASTSERNKDLEGIKNIHPTVKPIKLMAYLIELVCPEDGVVLDPFLGSGTTMIASIRLKRSCIGIEIDKETFDIARERILGEVRSLSYPLEITFE